MGKGGGGNGEEGNFKVRRGGGAGVGVGVGGIFKVSRNEVGGNTSRADIVKKKRKRKKNTVKAFTGGALVPASLPPPLRPSALLSLPLSTLPSLCQVPPSSSQWERLRLLQPPSI